MKKLNARITRLDAAWFAHRPYRTHRIRRSDTTEVLQILIAERQPPPRPPSGECWFTAVRDLGNGSQTRLYFAYDAAAPTDDAVDEEHAAMFFDELEAKYIRMLMMA